MDNFYARYFNNRTIVDRSPAERWQRETAQLRNLATSPWAQELKERFDVPEVTEAEETFNALLKEEIADPELRNKIDMAVGKITRAYEILGFCTGHFSQDSRATAL